LGDENGNQKIAKQSIFLLSKISKQKEAKNRLLTLTAL
jgi:hypothetical protein